MDDLELEVRGAVLDEARRILDPLPHVAVMNGRGRGSRTRAYMAHSKRGHTQRRGHVRKLGGMTVTVLGWSQSLHAQYREVECRFPKDAGTASAVAASTAALTTFATMQRRRIQMAQRDYGRDRPWETDEQDVSEIDHMRCDRYTLDWLAAEYGPAEARRHIGMMVTNINNEDSDGDRWIRGMVYGERHTRGDLAVDGARLFYAGPIPEVLVDSLPGRALSDLIDAGGAFGARRILSASNDRDAIAPLLSVDIEPDEVLIGEHLDALIAAGGATATIHA